jgi:hypothetical protein
MKLTGWKRTLLAGLVTLSVVGAPVATLTAGHAAAAGTGTGGHCDANTVHNNGTGCSLN